MYSEITPRAISLELQLPLQLLQLPSIPQMHFQFCSISRLCSFHSCHHHKTEFAASSLHRKVTETDKIYTQNHKTLHKPI